MVINKGFQYHAGLAEYVFQGENICRLGYSVKTGPTIIGGKDQHFYLSFLQIDDQNKDDILSFYQKYGSLACGNFVGPDDDYSLGEAEIKAKIEAIKKMRDQNIVHLAEVDSWSHRLKKYTDILMTFAKRIEDLENNPNASHEEREQVTNEYSKVFTEYQKYSNEISSQNINNRPYFSNDVMVADRLADARFAIQIFRLVVQMREALRGFDLFGVLVCLQQFLNLAQASSDGRRSYSDVICDEIDTAADDFYDEFTLAKLLSIDYNAKSGLSLVEHFDMCTERHFDNNGNHLDEVSIINNIVGRIRGNEESRPHVGYETLEKEKLVITGALPISESVLISVGNSILTHIINFHLTEVTPTIKLVSDEAEAEWSCPSLLAAIYFEYYLALCDKTIVRKCASKTCNKYFEIYGNDMRKIFCTTKCANTEAVRSYRGRKKHTN